MRSLHAAKQARQERCFHDSLIVFTQRRHIREVLPLTDAGGRATMPARALVQVPVHETGRGGFFAVANNFIGRTSADLSAASGDMPARQLHPSRRRLTTNLHQVDSPVTAAVRPAIFFCSRGCACQAAATGGRHRSPARPQVPWPCATRPPWRYHALSHAGKRAPPQPGLFMNPRQWTSLLAL